jgi:(E)-4-hydroxy-3-methylbut-2-enyl-diphosphate synthase
MTKTDTRDVSATVAQIADVAAAGCDMVRLAVPDAVAARAFRTIREQAVIPLVADIHFDHHLALTVLEGGADGLRLNPGNIGESDKVREVVAAARERGVPIRVGVNSGSIEKDIQAEQGNTPAALVASALRHVALIEDCDYDRIKISVKATDPLKTVEAYRLLAKQTSYPLHLGVTEAGTRMAGTIRSSVALGILLAEGYGDTIRVSLTDHPREEVRVGLGILRSLGLREPGPDVISCPTCGRVEVDVATVAAGVEQGLEELFSRHPEGFPSVAVMGCMVNGPGEAREADLAIAGGKGRFALYVGGERVRTVPEGEAVEALLAEVESWLGRT